MKKIFTVFIVLLFSAEMLNAQALRYYHKIFDSVAVSPDIVYGSNYTYNFLTGRFGLFREDLALDIYQAQGDTATKRPLIIWAHGGSFIAGSKEASDMVYFCNEYAQRGFVTVSMNYRLGFELPLDSIEGVRTVYRAVQDARAAVRYMRSKADSLNIDPNRIYFGGTSAGAFLGVNLVYFDQASETPDYLDTNERLSINLIRGFGLDGFEGTTNTINASSEIQGIINYAGATKTLNWLNDQRARETPIISVHGTADAVVPYATRTINLNDIVPIPEQLPIPFVQVSGSYDIDRFLDKNNGNSKLYTLYGAGHVPYTSFLSSDDGAAYMDTVMRFTVKHVYQDFLQLGTVEGIEENEPPCDFNNGVESPCESTVGINGAEKEALSIYPNPFRDVLHLDYGQERIDVQVYNAQGQLIFEQKKILELHINTSQWPKGLYSMDVQSPSLKTKEKLIKY